MRRGGSEDECPPLQRLSRFRHWHWPCRRALGSHVVRILVLGATGDIGAAAARAAVEAGYEVTAFVRSPERLGDLPDRLRVVVGEVTDAAALAGAVDGQDAVISAIGSSPEPAQLDVPANAMRHLIAAMQRAGVRRLVALGGAALHAPGERKPLARRITSAIVRLLARNVVEAKWREFEVVRQSELDWTVVRPPRVIDGGPTGRVEVGPQLHGFRVTRGDVGMAMVRLAAEPVWLREAPYVSEASRQR